MSTEDPTPPHPHPHPQPQPQPQPQRDSTGLPLAPWVLCDRTSAEQIVTVLDRLEQWLAGGDPKATQACAWACSRGEEDAESVAAWVGTLGVRLADRLAEADSWL